MIKDAGGRWTIIGHSERRQYYGETDDSVSSKIRTVIGAGLAPIVCVGERLESGMRGAPRGSSTHNLREECVT